MQKRVIVTFCVCFVVSIAFPIVASGLDTRSRLLGYADVALALVVSILGIMIRLKRREIRSKGTRRLTLSVYKVLFSLPLVLLVAFLVGVKIKWEILLVGLAWRFWLLSLVLEDIVQFANRSPRDDTYGEYH
jgi:hypothetical protein